MDSSKFFFGLLLVLTQIAIGPATASDNSDLKKQLREACKATIASVIAQPGVMAQFDRLQSATLQLSSHLMVFTGKLDEARALRSQVQVMFDRIKSIRNEIKSLPSGNQGDNQNVSKLDELKKKLENANLGLSKLIGSLDSREILLGADLPRNPPPELFWTATALETTVDVSACTKGASRVCFHLDLLNETSIPKTKYLTSSLKLQDEKGHDIPLDDSKKEEISFDAPIWRIKDFSKTYLNYLVSVDKSASTLKSCMVLLTDKALDAVADRVESDRSRSKNIPVDGTPRPRPNPKGTAREIK